MDTPGTTGADSVSVHGVMNGGLDFGVGGHAEVVVGAPDLEA